MRKIYYLFMFILTMVSMNAQSVSPAGGKLYVTPAGGGTRDGSSWSNATTLADALKYAKQNESSWTVGAPLQIWVAKGTYKPKYTPEDGQNFSDSPADPRNKAFLLVNHVQIYGGFAGNEDDLYDRDWVNNPTILSGDFNGDDAVYVQGGTETITDNGENAYHVIISAEEVNTATTILDGVIIIGGNANGGYGGAENEAYTYVVNGTHVYNDSGGGMYNDNSSPSITNCAFIRNTAHDDGGGMYNDNSSPSITNCAFIRNTAQDNGAGMCNWGSSPSISNCTFSGNTAANGKGMSNHAYSSPKIYNTIIVGNVNGGIYNIGNSVPVIQYSLVEDYTADGYNLGENHNLPNTLTAGQVFENHTEGNYTLRAGSPAIDAGSNAKYLESNGGNKDLAGNNRGMGASIDMGAYEYQDGDSFIFFPKPTNNILYVKEGGTSDGSSWNNPIGLADALKYAKQNENSWTAGAPLQIWVAKGTYKPKYTPEDGQNFSDSPTDPRDRAFLLPNHVQIYGGFAGNEDDLYDRDWGNNPTILSGDFYGDDAVYTQGETETITDNGENAYHVVISAGEVNTETTILDGFIIKGGNAKGSGSITVKGKIFDRSHGGGMYNYNSSPSITNCTFVLNGGKFGGGMYNWFSSPSITHCEFSNNQILQHGGGILNVGTSSPSVSYCKFTENKAKRGGGMYNLGDSFPSVSYCKFTKNKAERGGGMLNNDSSMPSIINCEFTENKAVGDEGDGGGMCNLGLSSPEIINCKFTKNKAERGGGGIYNSYYSAPVSIDKCTFTENKAGKNGGGMLNVSEKTYLITRCTFSRNDAENGGGMYNDNNNISLRIVNCAFDYNIASSVGGGMYNENASPYVINCVFIKNLSYFTGGGMYNKNSSPYITNCTLSRNKALEEGGGMYNDQAPSLRIHNTIIVGNVKGYSNQVSNIEGTVPFEIKYSLVEDYTEDVYEGNNNLPDDLTAEQVFEDPAADNYRLKVCSPAVNAGSNSLYNEASGYEFTQDLEGNPRTSEVDIDLGAYESKFATPTVVTGVVNLTYGDNEATAQTKLSNAVSATEGNTLQWYTTQTGGTSSTTAPTPNTATVGTTSYWVSQKNGCGRESSRVEVQVKVAKKELTLALTGDITKTYDGGTQVTSTIDASNFILSGIIDGDNVNIVSVSYTSATYADASEGINKLVTVVEPVITLGGEKAGNYSVSTADVSAYIGVIEASLARQEMVLPELNLYPNPVFNILTITTEAVVKEVKVYTNTGQLVLSSTATTLDLSSLASGVYYININTDKGSTTKKVIKK